MTMTDDRELLTDQLEDAALDLLEVVNDTADAVTALATCLTELHRPGADAPQRVAFDACGPALDAIGALLAATRPVYGLLHQLDD